MHPVEYKVAGQRRPIDKSSGRRIVAGVVALWSHGASVPNTKGIGTRSDGVESRLNKLAARGSARLGAARLGAARSGSERVGAKTERRRNEK